MPMYSTRSKVRIAFKAYKELVAIQKKEKTAKDAARDLAIELLIDSVMLR